MNNFVRQTSKQKEAIREGWAGLGITDPEETVSPVKGSLFRDGLKPLNQDTDIRTVAKRLKSSLGYGALDKELKLVDILLDANVKIFDSDSVERYKDKVLEAKNMKARIVNRALEIMRFGGMIFGALGLALLIIFGISSIFGGLTVFSFFWKFLWTVTIVSAISFAIAYYIGDSTVDFFDADAEWEWDIVSIRDCEDIIPTIVLVKIDEINQLVLRSKIPVVFEVHSLRKIEVLEDPILDDPFVSVRLKQSENMFYFGVWSEPSFKGMSYIP